MTGWTFDRGIHWKGIFPGGVRQEVFPHPPVKNLVSNGHSPTCNLGSQWMEVVITTHYHLYWFPLLIGRIIWLPGSEFMVESSSLCNFIRWDIYSKKGNFFHPKGQGRGSMGEWMSEKERERLNSLLGSLQTIQTDTRSKHSWIRVVWEKCQ